MSKVKKSNIDVAALKRASKASAESKFEWLQSALEFARMKKVVRKRKG